MSLHSVSFSTFPCLGLNCFHWRCSVAQMTFFEFWVCWISYPVLFFFWPVFRLINVRVDKLQEKKKEIGKKCIFQHVRPIILLCSIKSLKLCVFLQWPKKNTFFKPLSHRHLCSCGNVSDTKGRSFWEQLQLSLKAISIWKNFDISAMLWYQRSRVKCRTMPTKI